MDENKMKKIYLLLMSVLLLFTIVILLMYQNKSVVCTQDNNTIICENLAIVNRKCIIYYGNSSELFYIKGLNKIYLNTTERLLGWICQ